MDLGLAGRVAIVTGASEGIGYAIALSLAREGAKVAINARNPDKLRAAADAIRERTDAEIIAEAADMCSPDDVSRFFQSVFSSWGTIHILVNNVGRATRATFEELSARDWQKALEANLTSAVLATQQVLPKMKAQRWGRIINIAAVSAKQPSPNLMASNAGKSAMLAFSKSLANEVGRHNILVNTVCPGRILSPQIVRLFSEKERDAIASAQIPLGRFGEVEELADLVAFLASERASYLTGTTIEVDGGFSKGLY
jgi:NAD(P)-dependent dehydrogenase (short-subunit alcohol dehydrogenase family)